MRPTPLLLLVLALGLDPVPPRTSRMVQADGAMGMLKAGAGVVTQGVAFGSIAAATNFLFTGLFNHRKNMNEALAKQRLIAEAELKLEKLKGVNLPPSNMTAIPTKAVGSIGTKSSDPTPEEEMDEEDRALLHHQHLSIDKPSLNETGRQPKDEGNTPPSSPTNQGILINATVVNGTVVDAAVVNNTVINGTMVNQSVINGTVVDPIVANSTSATPTQLRKSPAHRHHHHHHHHSPLPTPSSLSKTELKASIEAAPTNPPKREA
ncbi:hypothetical protein BJ684DRAFT_22188 [Piptocephalis cylindrospora]|uniref:Uncharacterized protein n=1 Tax=Piptocephalis cylindrospora TaxID=1907219 RepID=A0A4P9XZR9_9FUNG|nr:hypothetical protein BJ684DRAFT_22188 [Piptocephalis cylindrospora]|eukprot:RKP11261.1 hypothetical protein BJ684DRAFT_22188 [Piptocephalis cylindrospora]